MELSGKSYEDDAVNISISHGTSTTEGSRGLEEPGFWVEWEPSEPFDAVIFMVPLGSLASTRVRDAIPDKFKGDSTELEDVILACVEDGLLSLDTTLDLYSVLASSTRKKQWQQLAERRDLSVSMLATIVLARLGDVPAERRFCDSCLSSQGNRQLEYLDLIGQMPKSDTLLETTVALILAERIYRTQAPTGTTVLDIDRREGLIRSLFEYPPEKVTPYAPRLLKWAERTKRNGFKKALTEFLEHQEQKQNKLAAFLADKKALNATDSSGGTALLRASLAGDKTLLEQLLAHGAEVNAQNNYGWSALHSAVFNGHKSIVALLLTNNANVNLTTKDGRTPLLMSEQYTEIAQLLIEHGANVHARGNDGFTSMQFAASRGNTSLVSVLLSHKADINEGDNFGTTPLHQASGSISVSKAAIDFLLAHGANLEATRRDGMTPLHWAAAWGTKDTVAALLAHHANVNARGKDGKTPLHWALKKQELDSLSDVEQTRAIVTLLLCNNADINTKDNDRITPLAELTQRQNRYKQLNGHPSANYDDLIALLRKHGAKE